MDFGQITEIIELRSTGDVNRYLAAGWRLINTFINAYDNQPPGVYYQTLVYSLGWIGDNPIHPENPKKWDIKPDVQ